MFLRTLPALGLALSRAAPALAQNAELKAVPDRAWCDKEYSGDDEGTKTCTVYEATLPAAGSISVDGRPNGGIEVRGWDRNEVRLRAKVVARAESQAEARQLASEVRVVTGPTIRAEGPRTEGRYRSWYVSYKLDVPHDQALNLQSLNGGIHLENLDGSVDFTTTNGGLHLKNMGGSVKGRTTNGGVHVELAGTEWRGDGLDLLTTNGGVHLQVPSGYNAQLEVGTTNGRVHSSLGARSSSDDDDDDADDEDSGARRGRHDRKRNLSLTLGSGGRLLRLRTTNGGVHIGQD
jgi:hypothetical protein